MIDKSKHLIVLKRLLREIYQDQVLPTALAFKGGTCLYLFHGLDRFSTDLDFSLVSDAFDPDRITAIVKKHFSSFDFREKRYTWFWLGSYAQDTQKIKIEISKRQFSDSYCLVDFYGTSIRSLSKASMLAHKLCAITDRARLQNRDLYDVWFMLRHDFQIEEAIIRERTQQSSENYLGYLADWLEKKKNIRILDGLGEVLDQEQRQWVKEHLLAELVFELKNRSE